MRAAGLWSLPADYHASNFYPQVEDRADARYGAFIQLWAVRRGAGRVLAFTDSTVFSNFSAFEPGRTELMLGMIEWLNHRNRGPDPRPWLLGAGGVLWLLALTGMGGRRWLPPLAALTLFGWAGAVLAVRAHHPVALPLPAPRRPLTEVVVDRTLSDAPLSKCGFIKASPEGFGIFEQWILRLGYFTARREGARAFEGRGMVILEPDRLATEAFRTRLVDYVKRGGRVLVVDSALSRQSTVNSLLHPFGLSVDMASDVAGVLEPPAGWPAVPVESVRTVNGGEPLFTVAGQPVGARAGFGQGAVVLIGFGARFNDDHMGITTDIEPDAAMRQVYELEFRLLRHLMEETADGDAS
jgi:hypothetical protein